MTTQHPFFADFAAALLEGQADRLSAHLAAQDHSARMAVYRNTSVRGQIEALAAAYPTVSKAMGEARFSALGAAFADAHPLRTRTMALYGAQLASFIHEHAQDAHTRVLADFAQLDRAWLEASTARDVSPLVQADYICGGAVSLHPSARICALSFGALTAWRALKSEADVTNAPITDEPQTVLIWRPYTEVCDRALTVGEAAALAHFRTQNCDRTFVESGEATVAREGSLIQAAMIGAAADPTFQPEGTLAGMVAAGVFCRPLT